MATAPVIPNVYAVTAEWALLDGKSASNVWHCSTTSPIDAAHAQVVAGVFIGALGFASGEVETGMLQPVISSAVTLTSVTARALDGSEVEATQTSGRAGAGSGNPCPPQVASLVSWSGGTSFKGGHPRTYLPGLTDTQLDVVGGAFLGSGALTALGTGWANFMTFVNAGGTSPATTMTLGFIRSKPIVPTPSSPPLRTYAFQPILGHQVKTRICTQRRRLGKTGA